MNLTLSLCKCNLTSSKLNKNLVCYVNYSPVSFLSTGLDFQDRTDLFEGVEVGSRVEHAGLTGDFLPFYSNNGEITSKRKSSPASRLSQSKLFQPRPSLNHLVAARRDTGLSGLVTDALTPLHPSLYSPSTKHGTY